jgi:NRPS condensation-like uncharacterized protein
MGIQTMQHDRLLRQLDPGERFIWLVDSISSMNFVVIAEIRGHAIAEDRLRRGLGRLQECHPLLASRVAQQPDGSLAFRSSANPIPVQVEERSEADWHRSLEASLGQQFDAASPAPARCHLLHLPRRTVLALTFHHVIADGRSAVDLLKELLRYCLRGIEPDSTAEVPPPMHSLFPPAFKWGERHAEAYDLAKQIAEEALIKGPPAELPFLTNPGSPKLPRIETLRFDREQGQRLKARCREEAATVHGAIGAAQVIAMNRLFETEDERTFHLFSPVDLRPHIADGLNGRLSYCSSALQTFHRVNGASDFWDLAREITAELRRRVERGEGTVNYSLLPLNQVVPDGPGFDAFTTAVRQRPAGSNVSNVGRIATLDDCPEVEVISFALCSIDQHLNSLYVSSYDDQLVVNQTYDAAKLAPPVARKMADEIVRLLLAIAEEPTVLAPALP